MRSAKLRLTRLALQVWQSSLGFEVIDAEAGTVRIPIADAMDSTVAGYKAAK